MSERERERSLLPREKEKWKNKKKTEKTWDEDWKRRHLQQYVEQPREWKMKSLKDQKNQGNGPNHKKMKEIHGEDYEE